MKGIFICYRREDTSGYAGRLFDRLKERFGQERVFLDVAGIEPGVDFVETIDREVGSCDALVIMIGKRWLDCTDQNGQRRLDDQQDFIRLEVATALRRNIRVIPALVQGAAMPKESDLPEEMKLLARRQAFEISDSHWDNDVKELVRALEKVVPTSAGEAAGAGTEKPVPVPSRKSAALIATIVALVVIVGASGVFMMKKEEPKITATAVVTPGTEADHAAVPDVTGKPREPALTALKEAGFLTVREKKRNSDKPAGTVLSQQPIGGSVMMKNSAIELLVAEKPPASEKEPEPGTPSKPQPAEQLYPIPSVVRLPEKQAREMIASAGFRVGTVVSAETDKYRPGTVISQSPEPSETAHKGEAVNLQLAVAPKKQPPRDTGDSTAKEAGNWVVIMNNAKLSYSFRSPLRSATNIVKAETREIIHDQEYYKRVIKIRQAKNMSTEGYERFSYQASIVELDCTNNKYRLLASRDFDANDKELGRWKESAVWQDIPVNSKYDYLSKRLCR